MAVGTADGVTEGPNVAAVLADMAYSLWQMIRQGSSSGVSTGRHTRAELQLEFGKVQVPHHGLYAR